MPQYQRLSSSANSIQFRDRNAVVLFYLFILFGVQLIFVLFIPYNINCRAFLNYCWASSFYFSNNYPVGHLWLHNRFVKKIKAKSIIQIKSNGLHPSQGIKQDESPIQLLINFVIKRNKMLLEQK